MSQVPTRQRSIDGIAAGNRLPAHSPRSEAATTRRATSPVPALGHPRRQRARWAPKPRPPSCSKRWARPP